MTPSIPLRLTSPPSLKTKDSGADAIMMYLIGPDIPLFLQAIQAAGITTPILNNSTASASDLTAAALLENQVYEAVTSTSVLINGAPDQGYQPYVTLLQKLYGKTAGGSAVGTEFDTYDLMDTPLPRPAGPIRPRSSRLWNRCATSPSCPIVNHTFTSSSMMGFTPEPVTMDSSSFIRRPCPRRGPDSSRAARTDRVVVHSAVWSREL